MNWSTSKLLVKDKIVQKGPIIYTIAPPRPFKRDKVNFAFPSDNCRHPLEGFRVRTTF